MMASSSENTDLTVPSEARIRDQTRKFVSDWKPSTKARRPGVEASPDSARAPASPINPVLLISPYLVQGAVKLLTDLIRDAQATDLMAKLGEPSRR